MNTSRKLLIAGAAALAGMAVASAAAAQASATGTGTSSVLIIKPISITAPTDLVFGKVVPGTTDGTVVIGTSADTATADGGTGATLIAGSTTSRAKFTVTGEPGETYTVTPPQSDLTFDGSTAPGLKVTSWTSSITGVGGGTLSTGGTSGTQDFYIGGTLDVPATTPRGTYSGTFQVTVAYN